MSAFLLVTTLPDSDDASNHNTLMGAMAKAQDDHDVRIDWEAFQGHNDSGMIAVLSAHCENSDITWLIMQCDD